jgi:hypothetical protein
MPELIVLYTTRFDLLNKHKQNYTQHNTPTNNNLLASPVLLRKNCTRGSTSTGQRVSRRGPENVPTNSQNGPKSEQISDPLNKHKQNYTQHDSPMNNNSRSCPVLFRKNCAPGGASTGQRVSRRGPENVPTNSQNGPKCKQRSEPLNKHKQNYTQHNSPTNNNSRACLVLLRKNCTPGGTSTGQRVSRRDPENEPTNVYYYYYYE